MRPAITFFNIQLSNSRDEASGGSLTKESGSGEKTEKKKKGFMGKIFDEL
ncbi:hypothetical protein [Roseburia sp. 831b]|nr:hypothetical protein [Roseburia sp. 831b]WVK73639.1 hypothetical protein BIV16_03775 [Roseburia sp. 831b]